MRKENIHLTKHTQEERNALGSYKNRMYPGITKESLLTIIEPFETELSLAGKYVVKCNDRDKAVYFLIASYRIRGVLNVDIISTIVGIGLLPFKDIDAKYRLFSDIDVKALVAAQEEVVNQPIQTKVVNGIFKSSTLPKPINVKEVPIPEPKKTRGLRIVSKRQEKEPETPEKFVSYRVLEISTGKLRKKLSSKRYKLTQEFSAWDDEVELQKLLVYLQETVVRLYAFETGKQIGYESVLEILTPFENREIKMTVKLLKDLEAEKPLNNLIKKRVNDTCYYLSSQLSKITRKEATNS